MKYSIAHVLPALLFSSIFFLIHAAHTMHFNPKTYAQNNQPQRDWIQHINIPSSDLPLTILDVGCGDGKATVDLLKNFPHSTIVGIDPNHQMIDFAKHTHAVHTNISWCVVGAEDIHDAERFDIAVSFSTLQWIQDITKALKNIHTALKKDGFLYAILSATSNPNISSFSTIYSCAVAEQCENPKYSSALAKLGASQLSTIIHKYNPKQFEELLKKSGFTTSSCKAQETAFTFPTKEKFVNWIRAISPLGNILDDLHPSFCHDVASTYIDMTHQKDKETVVYNHYLLYAMAQK